MTAPIPHAAVTRGTDRVRCAPLACVLSAQACAARHVARLGGRGTPGRVALLVLPDVGHPL